MVIIAQGNNAHILVLDTVTEFVLFFNCSDLIDFVFIFITILLIDNNLFIYNDLYITSLYLLPYNKHFRAVSILLLLLEPFAQD